MVKIIKLLYYISKIDNHLFAIYYSYYKEKLKMIKTVYNSNLYYNPDKLGIIASIY